MEDAVHSATDLDLLIVRRRGFLWATACPDILESVIHNDTRNKTNMNQLFCEILRSGFPIQALKICAFGDEIGFYPATNAKRGVVRLAVPIRHFSYRSGPLRVFQLVIHAVRLYRVLRVRDTRSIVLNAPMLGIKYQSWITMWGLG